MKGKVKWFNQVKGYGFITREDGLGDVFVHHSAVERTQKELMIEGSAVEFEIRNGPKGDNAHSIKFM